MSHVDSKDEEKGTILEPDKPDDSKESDTPENDEFNEYDISDDKELDDKDW